MPQQNQYKQQNTRPATIADYVLLGNLIASDPTGPQNTAALNTRDFMQFLQSAVTANVTAEHGQVIPANASSATVTVTAPASPSIGNHFGVYLMAIAGANELIVNGNGYEIQQPLTSGLFVPSVSIFPAGASFSWTLKNPDNTTAKWYLSADAGAISLATRNWTDNLITPTLSPYQAAPFEVVRYDVRTATSENDLIIRTPQNARAPMWFAVKEVFGENKLLQIDTNDPGVVIENPRAIPATASQNIYIGGSGEYLEWQISENGDIWLTTNRFIREQNSAHMVVQGTSTNGDVPAGNVKSTFNLLKASRVSQGVYDFFFQTAVASGSVLVANGDVFTTNLPADTFGHGHHIGTTYGAAGTAKVTMNYGYRNKNGQWSDSDFDTAGDSLIVRIAGLAE